MKKILKFFLVLSSLFLFAACGKDYYKDFPVVFDSVEVSDGGENLFVDVQSKTAEEVDSVLSQIKKLATDRGWELKSLNSFEDGGGAEYKYERGGVNVRIVTSWDLAEGNYNSVRFYFKF